MQKSELSAYFYVEDLEHWTFYIRSALKSGD